MNTDREPGRGMWPRSAAAPRGASEETRDDRHSIKTPCALRHCAGRASRCVSALPIREQRTKIKDPNGFRTDWTSCSARVDASDGNLRVPSSAPPCRIPPASHTLISPDQSACGPRTGGRRQPACCPRPYLTFAPFGHFIGQLTMYSSSLSSGTVFSVADILPRIETPAWCTVSGSPETSGCHQ